MLDDRFVIDRRVASGGAGIVYRALDREHGGAVAIKVVHSSTLTDPRFAREVESLAKLRHPAIVRYLGHGSFEDDLYLAMEWLEGEDLDRRLKGSELGVDEAVGVARQLAAALAEAHRHDIVHRDIKPSNVFLVDGSPDQVKLLDFGLARHAGLGSLTTSGMLIGTPLYMAPEQARGSSELDARVDVYGLGALLFRCLAGRPPFAGGTIDEIIARILSETAPRLQSLNAAVPAEIDALVASMLSKTPARRPADGAAVHVALMGIESTSARPGVAARRPIDAGGALAFAAPVTLDAGRTASSIAVLSFVDMSEARDQEYLCDGIAEELINALAHLEGLRVVARSSSFQLKSSAAGAREVGAQLGVDAILEGAVRRAGDRLRVTVQLVDVGTGYQRWAQRFDGTFADVFAIEDEIARDVATALRGLLSIQEKDAIRRPETTAEAYAYFLRGRQLINSMSAASYRSAQEMFQRAIDVDPSYAPAYAALAQMHCRHHAWGGGGEIALAAADRASRRALELAPQLAESHVARGHVLKVLGRREEAERAYKEAIRIHPQSFDAHYQYARLHFESGRIEDAVAWFRRAADLQLEDYQCPLLLALSLRTLGRVEEARDAGREGIRRAERQLALDPHDHRALILGAIDLHHDEQPQRAREWAMRAVDGAPDDPGIWYNAACFFAVIGDKDQALNYLEKAFELMVGGRDWALHDADLDVLRDDPRFQALVARRP